MSAKRTLVIDDEPNVIRLCQRALGQEGFVVKGALRGEEGLQLLREESFDLILLDVRLPDRDGLDVLSAIRQTDPEVPVIIITAHDTMEVTAKLLKSEAQDLLLKPFTLEELVNSVQKVLERDV